MTHSSATLANSISSLGAKLTFHFAPYPRHNHQTRTTQYKMKTMTKTVSAFPLYFACEREMKCNQTSQARAMFLRLHKKKCAKCQAEAKEEYGSNKKWEETKQKMYEEFHSEGLSTEKGLMPAIINGKSFMTRASMKYSVAKGSQIEYFAHA